MNKTGLIVEGGGMKCAYSAGILDRFLDDGICFDECIGVSAGSGNLASYLANQRERNLRFYTIYQNHPEYLGMRNYLKHGSKPANNIADIETSGIDEKSRRILSDGN